MNQEPAIKNTMAAQESAVIFDFFQNLFNHACLKHVVQNSRISEQIGLIPLKKHNIYLLTGRSIIPCDCFHRKA
jgi:hypothetical protein